jgi:oligopeptide transport system ATP-binding protein
MTAPAIDAAASSRRGATTGPMLGIGPLLEVEGLTTRFTIPGGAVSAVNDVSFTIGRGETVGIVGESGSGKSQALMSIMGLLPQNGTATGSVRFDGKEILGLKRDALNRLRGTRLSMIFQDPMTALNPYLTIGRQLTEVLTFHLGTDQTTARAAAKAILDRVHIPEAGKRLDMYPHELSGGMRQRVMIAMGMLCKPELLIADEPTTALDVTIQAEILDLLAELQRDSGTSIILVTHDLGVVAGLCDRVLMIRSTPTPRPCCSRCHGSTILATATCRRSAGSRRISLTSPPAAPLPSVASIAGRSA